MIPVGLEEIRAAREAIGGFIHRTPVVASSTLSRLTGTRAHLKLENLQKTGSFKPRGGLNMVRALGAEDRRRGVVTISAGNHAQGVAYAAAAFGVPATVVMPASASPVKAEAARGYGAEVVLHGDVHAAFVKLEEIRAERGLFFIHPFDAPGMVAGHGTLGLEIVEDVPEAEVVIAGIGGGGLISGVALAVTESRPAARVIGVEPEGAPAMRRSLDTGKPQRLDKVDTIADGLAAPFAGALNFEIVRERVDDVVLVTDDEIRRAMRFLLERCKILAEPAGAASTAALLSGKIRVPEGGRVVCIVSGGNVDPLVLAREMQREASGRQDPSRSDITGQ